MNDKWIWGTCFHLGSFDIDFDIDSRFISPKIRKIHEGTREQVKYYGVRWSYVLYLGWFTFMLTKIYQPELPGGVG